MLATAIASLFSVLTTKELSPSPSLRVCASSTAWQCFLDEGHQGTKSHISKDHLSLLLNLFDAFQNKTTERKEKGKTVGSKGTCASPVVGFVTSLLSKGKNCASLLSSWMNMSYPYIALCNIQDPSVLLSFRAVHSFWQPLPFCFHQSRTKWWDSLITLYIAMYNVQSHCI